MAQVVTDHVLDGIDLEERVLSCELRIETRERCALQSSDDVRAVLRLRSIEVELGVEARHVEVSAAARGHREVEQRHTVRRHHDV